VVVSENSEAKMTLDAVLSGVIYVFVSLLLIGLGRLVFFWRYRKIDAGQELVVRDNPAFGILVAAYYLALTIMIGGVMYGESNGLLNDIIDLVIYGVLGIFLLWISAFIADKIVFRKFSNLKEIIGDRNLGLAFAEGSIYIASALVLFGALNGEGGSIFTALAFWLLGQIAFVLLVLAFDMLTPYSMHKQLEADNTAVGLALGGFIISLGNILRVALSGDFQTWSYHLILFGEYLLAIILFFPIVNFLTDKLLLPGQKMADEIAKQNNTAAAVVAASAYIIVSLLLSWSF
jgi:uncharacterized membrane protein YjfL (UPF0719 family)